MGYVVRVWDGAGGSGWISKLNTQGVRCIGALRGAQVFPTCDDAHREITRLLNQLPSRAIQIKIEQE